MLVQLPLVAWRNPASRGPTSGNCTSMLAGPRAFRVPGHVVAMPSRAKGLLDKTVEQPRFLSALSCFAAMVVEEGRLLPLVPGSDKTVIRRGEP